MILKCFEIRPGSVHHRFFPLGQTTRHIPGRLRKDLLPGTMTFQIRLRHHIDSVSVTQIIPCDLIRIVAGTHGINMVSLKTLNIPFHILQGNASAAPGTPFMTVHPVDDQSFPVE